MPVGLSRPVTLLPERVDSGVVAGRPLPSLVDEGRRQQPSVASPRPCTAFPNHASCAACSFMQLPWTWEGRRAGVRPSTRLARHSAEPPFLKWEALGVPEWQRGEQNTVKQGCLRRQPPPPPASLMTRQFRFCSKRGPFLSPKLTSSKRH